MEWIMIFCFVAGYVAITLEHNIKINKAASALVAGVLCWTVYILGGHDAETVNHHLSEHISEITGIVFFLLGAMVIVELIDAHDGFENITQRIKTTDKRKLLWSVGFITFFLSAVLDNLTTTIVMVSLLRKLVADREDRMKFAGLVIIAANAGGAWSPLGDVTTTMLWIGGQITALNIVKMLFLPSVVCLLLPLWLLTRSMKGKVQAPARVEGDEVGNSTPYERNLVFAIGVGALLFVPIFKTVTHLPPYMGILLGLGVMWILTEFIHSGKDEIEKGAKSVNHALRKIDTPSILFFLGILVTISALESVGVLRSMAGWLDEVIGNVTIVGVLIGFLSAVVDNVPLVAAAQGMYSLEVYPVDSFFWELIAFCAGTGGSALIIGSAAGVAAMGMENISFTWYLRKFTLLASIGYLAGVAVYVLQHQIFG